MCVCVCVSVYRDSAHSAWSRRSWSSGQQQGGSSGSGAALSDRDLAMLPSLLHQSTYRQDTHTRTHTHTRTCLLLTHFVPLSTWRKSGVPKVLDILHVHVRCVCVCVCVCVSVCPGIVVDCFAWRITHRCVMTSHCPRVTPPWQWWAGQ